jgi:hypothetical protein
MPVKRCTGRAHRDFSFLVRVTRHSEAILVLPAALHPAHLWAMKKWQDDSRKVDLAAALQFQADFYRDIQNASFGDLPLTVINRAKSADDTGAWVEQQKQIAASSSRGTLLRAVGSGHDIELEQPDTVVMAIRMLIEKPG